MLMVRRPPARRAGFTLVELLIVMVLMSFVASAIVVLLVRQQRFYGSASTVIETRQQIRQAAGILPLDLRGISSIGGDIYAVTKDSIAFRSTFGTAVLCVTNQSSSLVYTVPAQLAKGGSALASWSALPTANVGNSGADSVAIYDNGPTAMANDDLWRRYNITSVAQVTGTTCPTSTGLVQTADQSKPYYKIGLSPQPTATISAGAGMRFFRRVVYKLYQGSDGQWYLGYYACKTGRTPVCNTIQPLAGPFQANGVQFSYSDSTGAIIPTPADSATRTKVALISVVVRGQAASPVNLTGGAATVFKDSVRIQVGLRNRM